MHQLFYQISVCIFALSISLHFYMKLRRASKRQWLKRKAQELAKDHLEKEGVMEKIQTLAYAYYCNSAHPWGSEDEKKIFPIARRLFAVAIFALVISNLIAPRSFFSSEQQTEQVERESCQ